MAHFEQDTEFIGLGCSCVMSYGLQALGLKKRTYPFDWLRSPIDGVIHLLQTDSEDFLTFAEVIEANTLNGRRMEKQIFSRPGVNKAKTLVRQLLDAAFSHVHVP